MPWKYGQQYSGELTVEMVRQLLSYDHELGLFIWKARPKSMFYTHRDWLQWNRKFAGTVAGYVNEKLSYCKIGLFGKQYSGARLAYFLLYGRWPKRQLKKGVCIEVDKVGATPVDHRYRKEQSLGLQGRRNREDAHFFRTYIRQNEMFPNRYNPAD